VNKIIEIKNLTKKYKDVLAVSDLSFSVREGELFAFLGVNGAGKSTTINILCGVLSKDSGSVFIDGVNLDGDADKIKSKIGVVFQTSVLDKSLTVRDNLAARAALYGIVGEEFEARLTYLSNLLDFSDILTRTVGKLSGGQRRRIDIARALLHNPKILILDEPTTGLDPQTRRHLWKVIEDLRKSEKMTVFLTTHYMEESADADYIIIIDSGKISAEGTPHDLKNKYSGDFVTVYTSDESVLSPLSVKAQKVPSGYRFAVPNTREATKLIVEHPEIFSDYEITKGKMDDVFLAVTGKTLTD
jgi:multidrug/hemolysin transport system ATP-binding protein